MTSTGPKRESKVLPNTLFWGLNPCTSSHLRSSRDRRQGSGVGDGGRPGLTGPGWGPLRRESGNRWRGRGPAEAAEEWSRSPHAQSASGVVVVVDVVVVSLGDVGR